MPKTSSPDSFRGRLESEYLDGTNRESLAPIINSLRSQLWASQKEAHRLKERLGRRERKTATHMLIGDSHHQAGVSTDRVVWAARLANTHRPDVIVDMGDWADMPSLWNLGNDRGRKSVEGANVGEDIQAAREARERFQNELDYEPRLVSCVGNHENRIDRFVDFFPMHSGTYTIEALGAEEFGWEVVPYGEVVVINGVCYCHTPLNPGTGKEIAGIHKAHQALTKGMMSVGFGHDHMRLYRELLRADQSKAMSIGTGCYFEHHEVYAGPTGNSNWWRGLVLVRDVCNGYGNVEFLPIEDIKRQYGN
ncbi:hypothetical protein [uncultured Mediterranean phage]|nr:hypothetical protein [uncultured Mediterranean phage]